MQSAFSSYQGPFDRHRRLRLGRFLESPARTGDFHFLLGHSADVIQRNRPLRARIQRLAGLGCRRGRREVAVRWL